jgi:hypothetical protein
VVEQINESPLMKRQLVDLKIFKAQLLLNAFKHVDCIGYSNANLEEGIERLFKNSATHHEATRSRSSTRSSTR